MFSIPCWPPVYLLPVQGFAHLKNLCFHHFVIELSEFLTYSGYKVFVRYRYCKYVLPVCVLSCHFNDHRFRILMKSNSSGFSFLWFCGFCKKSLQVIKKFSMLSLEVLQVWALYWGLWSISIVSGVRFICFPSSCSSTICWRLGFPCSTGIKIQVTIYLWVYFQTQFCSTDLSVLCQCHTILITLVLQ